MVSGGEVEKGDHGVFVNERKKYLPVWICKRYCVEDVVAQVRVINWSLFERFGEGIMRNGD